MDDAADRAERAKRGSPYLNTAQTAYYLGVSVYHLVKLRRSGKGPKFRRHSRFVQYHIDDIQAWSDARSQEREA
ncbi:DNA-binding protein [Nostoc sp. 3335mG]|nr:DNA-binding protein [Nostoc sp. 3335mG]